MKDFQVSKFSSFFLVGIDHKAAGVEIRENFSLSADQSQQLILDYKKSGGDGIMVLSTCNRTEVYAFASCPRDIIGLFCAQTGVEYETFLKYQKVKQNREAIEHLFRVGSGLESKILGDFEIIGQIKKSFKLSREMEAHNSFLDRLVNSAIQASKRVKNETSISNGAASTAFAAVQRIKNYISGQGQPKVLLYGTGKIGRTACENLVNQTGLKDITLVNRTEEKAEKLAQRFGLKHLDLNHLPAGLDDADIVILATGASQPTIHQSDFKTKKKRLILDLSMPRNASSDIYSDPHFEVIDIDHLALITEQNIENRKLEIPAAVEIVRSVADDFYTWLESRRVAPTLQAVRQRMDSWSTREVENLLKKYPDLNREHAEMLTNQLLNKITGQFARQLKSGVDTYNNLQTIHHIFALEN